MKVTMRKLIILVGLPCTGKSTYARNLTKDGGVVISTDDYIERVAKEQGKTYSDVFMDTIGFAIDDMETKIKLNQETDLVVIDQTNLSRKKRMKLIGQFPNHEPCIVVFGSRLSLFAWLLNVSSRPEKVISLNIVTKMFSSYEEPSFDEGAKIIYT
jgi:predicted kinase